MKPQKPILLFLLLIPIICFGQWKEDRQPGFMIKPYLQFSTQNQMSILWETSHPSTSIVEYGAGRFNVEKAILDQHVSSDEFNTMHEVTLDGLKVETNYFYKVTSVTAAGDTLQSEVLPFKTAVKANTPFAFTVFSDSQSNPEIWGKITNQALRDRPDFGLHAGDLVGLGYRKHEWVNHFFAPSNPYMKQIPLFTILGNHEHDAAFYYQYLKNPEPEHFYQFTYGNSEFFLIDTDQYQEPGTEMYHWLEHALASSDATWKFVIQHHPPYTTEENDFGDTNYELSLRGDEEAQMLIPLYEKYGVDIVFYGHIHMYERTWPLLNNKPVEKGGVLYLNVGGAGGKLEQASPTRAWFTNKTRTTHHYAYVAINGQTLQYQAIDEKGDLFDYFELKESRKKISSKELPPVTPFPERSRRIFRDTMHVHLRTVNDGDVIYYTTDGSAPSESNGDAMKDFILLEDSRTIRAMAKNDHGQSDEVKISYTKSPLITGEKLTNNFELGLNFEYFTGEMRDEKQHISHQLTLENSGKVEDFDFDKIPHRGRHWGVSYKGFIEVPESGYYKFNGHGYHIFRFYLHDELKIEEYKREIDGTTEVYLEKGLHPFELEYQTHRYYNYMRFEYTGPYGIHQPISNLNFYRKK
ncbi:metallophosphoesterase [Membranihabitans maritimus]|uniref:metallophosphoesterase n=1 Tax=Membranihabitans maritimus TaxID=2904244 RepID=UPI001F3F74B1|nr:metallophosphoesterase [Membranihabitans maritimus]